MIHTVEQKVRHCGQADRTDQERNHHEGNSVLPVTDRELDHGKEHEERNSRQPDDRRSNRGGEGGNARIRRIMSIPFDFME